MGKDIVGLTYDDPEGRWTIFAVNGADAVVECIDSKCEENIGRFYGVPIEEVEYYLNLNH